MSPLFNRVVIVGVGLIGSSLGMNIVKKKLAREVIGVGRNPANLREAMRRKAIHRFVGARFIAPLLADLSENDLVILASPVQSILNYLKLISQKPLVMDVGSTKASIVKVASRKKIRFVGSHPMAGTENSGAVAGELDLFRGRHCFITSLKKNEKDVQKIEILWKRLGSTVSQISPEKHDQLVALVSHLPHAVAFSLMKAVGAQQAAPLHLSLRNSFGSLKGMTRIAASPSSMWHDIFLENRQEVLKSISAFQKELQRLALLLRRKDSRRLLAFLQKTRKARQKFFS